VTVSIEGIEFDNVTYDAPPTSAICGSASRGSPPTTTPYRKGTTSSSARTGALIAVTIVNAPRILEREGKVTITIPERRLEATDLGAVLAAA